MCSRVGPSCRAQRVEGKSGKQQAKKLEHKEHDI